MAEVSFEYHPEATAEATEAYQWYAERSDKAAEDFLAELKRARKLVCQLPKLHAKFLHGTRCVRLKRVPYGLVYVERGERIVGIAVAHLKRKPGYWRHRMRE